MELYNKKDNPGLGDGDKTLHDEGVDLVGSGVREENEFTGSEQGGSAPSEALAASQPESAPTSEPVPKKDVAPAAAVLVPPIAHMAPPMPLPEQKERPRAPDAVTDKKDDPSIKPLRTFKSDAEEAVRYQNVSAVDIAVAEQKKRESTPIQYVENKSSHASLLVGIVILLLAGGAGYYWYSSIGPAPGEAVPAQVSVETLIPYSTGSTLVLKGNDNMALIGAKLATAEPGPGNIYALVPTLFATSTEPADVNTVFEGTAMPSRLSRSLAREYMIGSYQFETSSPFVILKTTFFQNAFAGMLEWEKEMRNDFLPIIRAAHSAEVQYESIPGQFEDIVISNIDARALRNVEGNIIIIYAFADTDTIIISTGETALKYVLDRLLAVRSVQ